MKRYIVGILSLLFFIASFGVAFGAEAVGIPNAPELLHSQDEAPEAVLDILRNYQVSNTDFICTYSISNETYSIYTDFPVNPYIRDVGMAHNDYIYIGEYEGAQATCKTYDSDGNYIETTTTYRIQIFNYSQRMNSFRLVATNQEIKCTNLLCLNGLYVWQVGDIVFNSLLVGAKNPFDNVDNVDEGHSLIIYNTTDNTVPIKINTRVGIDEDYNWCQYNWRYYDSSRNKTSMQFFTTTSYNMHGIEPGDWIIVENVGKSPVIVDTESTNSSTIELNCITSDTLLSWHTVHNDMKYCMSAEDIRDRLVFYYKKIGFDPIRFFSIDGNEAMEIAQYVFDNKASWFLLQPHEFIITIRNMVDEKLGFIVTDDGDLLDNTLSTLILEKGATVDFVNISDVVQQLKVTANTGPVEYSYLASDGKHYFTLADGEEAYIQLEVGGIISKNIYLNVTDTESNNALTVEYDNRYVNHEVLSGSVVTPDNSIDFLNLDSPPNRNNYPSGFNGSIQYYLETLIYWLLYPIKLILLGLKNIVLSILHYIAKSKDVLSLITQVYGWLPSELSQLITFGLSVAVIYGVIKMIRG